MPSEAPPPGRPQPLAEREPLSGGRPFKLTIAALGGEGGGVLADWLIAIGEQEGALVQATSVPGVAQRTGATIYYLEFFARAAVPPGGREPVMALMPVPGDVDCVVASELAEAGRAIQRGLVSPERTTLICSTHRSYSIAEKSALGSGAVDSQGLIELARSHSKRLILFDMHEMATRFDSVVSSVLLGAICGSGVLPFRRESFAAAITHSGISVATNLRAFEEAARVAGEGGRPEPEAPVRRLPEGIPAQAASAEGQRLLERLRALPPAVQPLALAGVRRLIDYQDPRYAASYLQRLERIVALDTPPGGGPAAPPGGEPFALSAAVARALALWMSFEDTIRVADLKTRRERMARVHAEVRTTPDQHQLIGITDFVKPRVAEIAGTLPAGIGLRVRRSPSLQRLLGLFTGGRRIRTSTIAGFLMLYAVASLKRWRRLTLRFREEDARIVAWLVRIERLAPLNYALATELARLQRLIKGYGDTHERGWRAFAAITAQLPALERRGDGGAALARLQQAALADEDGIALAAELDRLAADTPAPTAAAARAAPAVSLRTR